MIYTFVEMHFTTLFVPALALTAMASPTYMKRQDHEHTSEVDPNWVWDANGTPEYPIHSSCNVTQRTQLRQALGEMIDLAEHAKDHILRWGNTSAIYQKYFGNAPSAEPIGWYARVVSADRTGMLFRCDDPDRNCETQDGWGGHWRGENATQETVICPLSFSAREWLSGLCAFGYTVAAYPTNFYFASDLLHRVYHVPKISEGIVEHFTEDYAGVLELAQTEPELSVRDSDTLQLFALETYAYDIAVPGIGCPGEAETPETTPTATPVATSTASATSSAASSCHTHDDGVIHCE